MTLSYLLTKAVSALLLPPLDLILICAAGLALRRNWPRAGLALSASALIALAVIGTPAGARLFLGPLENRSAPLASARDAAAQAIVVLGGGRIRNAPEYGNRDIPALIPLARLRYAARLQRETGLPILVSGGAPDDATEPEAAIMARSLREDFAVPVKWIEGRSDDTVQNAAFSAALLQQQGVRRILLVTDGIHMPRATALFRKTGLEVIPAPTALHSRGRLTPIDFIPSGEGLSRTHYAIHEWLGLARQSMTP